MTKIIHVSDLKIWDGYSIYDQLGKPDDIFYSIIEEAPKLVIINIHYKTRDVLRSDNAGIRLLKLLRLAGFKEHCIIYSFYSREQLILQDPKNVILFSEGISFFQLPFDITKIVIDDLIKKNVEKSLKPFFMAENNLPDNRHFTANWWAVYQLFKVQNTIGESENHSDTHSNSNLSKEMNSYEGLLLRYLNDISNEEIVNNLIKQNEINISSNENVDNIEFKNEEIERIVEVVFNKNYPKLIFRLLRIFKSIFKVKQKNGITFLEDKNIVFENEKIILNEDKKNNIITTGFLENFETKKDEIINIRNNVKNANFKILFVDDQADEGWSLLFQNMIYGSENENFNVIIPNKNDDCNKIASDIIQVIIDNKIDLLILDLRLKDERGNIDVDKVSGIKVLNIIQNRKKYLCPIMITSASNKIWSYNKTIDLGADAFWIKQGVEQMKDSESVINSYMEFISLVNKLLNNEESKMINSLAATINNIDSNDKKYWWETNFWDINQFGKFKKNRYLENCKENNISKDKILDLLKNILSHLIKYRFIKINNLGEYNTLLPLIVMEGSIIMETIHYTEVKKDNGKKQKFTLMENVEHQTSSYLGQDIVKTRNTVAHTFSISYDNTAIFLNRLSKYLTNELEKKRVGIKIVKS